MCVCVYDERTYSWTMDARQEAHIVHGSRRRLRNRIYGRRRRCTWVTDSRRHVRSRYSSRAILFFFHFFPLPKPDVPPSVHILYTYDTHMIQSLHVHRLWSDASRFAYCLFRPYVASIERIVLIPGRAGLPRAKLLSFNAVIKTITLPTRYESLSFDVVYSRHNPDMFLF